MMIIIFNTEPTNGRKKKIYVYLLFIIFPFD